MTVDWKLETGNWKLEQEQEQEQEQDQDNIAVVYVFGQLGKQEYDQIQSEIELAIKKIGHIKILVILQDFTGWESAEGWGDISFYDDTDAYIKKTAILGDAQWKDMVTVFTLKGLRPVPIEYFETSDESSARKWLSTD